MSDQTPETKDDATQLADSIEKAVNGFESLKSEISDIRKTIEEKSAVTGPFGGKAPAFIVGELSNSRPFSFGNLMKAQVAMARGENPDEHAKAELEFCRKAGKAFGMTMAVPVSADYLSRSGDTALAKEWSEMQAARGEVDRDELAKIYSIVGKDLTFRTATTGGTMVSMPRQGELIELLRAQTWHDRAGFQEVPLPSNGSIRYPRVTGGVTISSYAESEAATESTPSTSEVLMEAKGYTGLVEVTEQFLKFADTVAGDAFIRSEMTKDIALQIDSDVIDGPGGKSIQGLINYSGITSLTASTTGANGDTLEPADVDLLIATMADANVPVDRGVTVVLRNKMWSALKFREDTNGRPKFSIASESFGGGPARAVMSGYPVVTTSQIPGTRVKASSGATLTLVLAVVGSEILFGRSGAIEIKMTDSHGSNFSSGIMSLRGTHYCDVVPRHEASVGLIDQLVIG